MSGLIVNGVEIEVPGLTIVNGSDADSGGGDGGKDQLNDAGAQPRRDLGARGRAMTRRASPLVLAALCCCCHPNPKIEAFHVTPAGYCRSSKQPIHVDWKTSNGDTTLQVKPDDPAPKPVASSGHRELEPHDMEITLTVSDGELHPHVVQPVRAAERHTLNAAAAKCQDGWVESEEQAFGSGSGSGAFAVQSYPSIISNVCAPGAGDKATCHRDAKVTHAGKTWVIAANGIKDISADRVPMDGTWVVAQTLFPDEHCGDASASSAQEIDLNLDIGCMEGVSYGGK